MGNGFPQRKRAVGVQIAHTQSQALPPVSGKTPCTGGVHPPILGPVLRRVYAALLLFCIAWGLVSIALWFLAESVGLPPVHRCPTDFSSRDSCPSLIGIALCFGSLWPVHRLFVRLRVWLWAGF